MIGRHVTIDPTATIAVDNLTLEDGVTIGAHAVLEGTRIHLGEAVYVGPHAWLGAAACRQPHAHLVVGPGSVLGHHCMINIGEGVTIGDETALSMHVQVYTHHHWQSVLDGYPAIHAPVSIGAHVHVATNTIVAAGTVIEDGALIGANTVVSGLIPARAYVVGNPAQVLRTIPELTRAQRLVIARRLHCQVRHLVTSPVTLQDLTLTVGDTVFDLDARTITGPWTPDGWTVREWLRRRGIRFTPRCWRPT